MAPDPLPLLAVTTVLTKTRGRYYLARPYYNSGSVVTFRDDSYSIAVITLNVGVSAMTLGQDWILNHGLLALSEQPPHEIDLDALPAPANETTNVAARRIAQTPDRPNTSNGLRPTIPRTLLRLGDLLPRAAVDRGPAEPGAAIREARRWFHTIFDPTSNRPVDPALTLAKQEAVRYWSFPPFRDRGDR